MKFSDRATASLSGQPDRSKDHIRATNTMTLAVVSHVPHYRVGKQIYAYGPYAHEIDIWADLFSRVVIAAPLRNQEPPGDCVAFTRGNIDVAPQKEAGGDNLRAKLALIWAAPGILCNLAQVFRRADAIHVRCPGNLGLLGVLLGPLFSRRLIAKYAGQWIDYVGEPWSTRLQKKLLASRWWRGPVTVYGKWPNQPAHVIPFFTSILLEQQMEQARRSAQRPRSSNVTRALYVGRLSTAKNVDILLRSLAMVIAHGVQIDCTIVGEGPEHQKLVALCSELGLTDRIHFAGGLPFYLVLDHLEQSDVLVLASETEGWPKAIAEGMAFGLVCIGSDRGLVPQMLSEGRGIVVPPRDVEALANVLQCVAASSDGFVSVRARAAGWAQQYTLEGLREALRKLLVSHWQLPAESAQGIRREGCSPDA